jgi:hypothetical protein
VRAIIAINGVGDKPAVCGSLRPAVMGLDEPAVTTNAPSTRVASAGLVKDPLLRWVLGTYVPEFGGLALLIVGDLLTGHVRGASAIELAGLALVLGALPWMQWRNVKSIARGGVLWFILAIVGRLASIGVLVGLATVTGHLHGALVRSLWLCVAGASSGAVMGGCQGLAFQSRRRALPRWAVALAMTYLFWVFAAIILTRNVSDFDAWIRAVAGRLTGSLVLGLLTLIESVLTGAALIDIRAGDAGSVSSGKPS